MNIGDTITLTAETVAPGALTYVWEFWDGQRATTTVPTITKIANRAGVLTYRLTVVDAIGQSAYTEDTVTVNGAPVIAVSSISTNDSVTPFNSTVEVVVTDPEAASVSILWTLNGTLEFTDTGVASGATTSHEFTVAADSTLEITAVDTDGASSSLTCYLRGYTAGIRSALIAVSPEPSTVGQPVLFELLVTYPEGVSPPANASWVYNNVVIVTAFGAPVGGVYRHKLSRTAVSGVTSVSILGVGPEITLPLTTLEIAAPTLAVYKVNDAYITDSASVWPDADANSVIKIDPIYQIPGYADLNYVEYSATRVGIKCSSTSFADADETWAKITLAFSTYVPLPLNTPVTFEVTANNFGIATGVYYGIVSRVPTLVSSNYEVDVIIEDLTVSGSVVISAANTAWILSTPTSWNVPAASWTYTNAMGLQTLTTPTAYVPTYIGHRQAVFPAGIIVNNGYRDRGWPVAGVLAHIPVIHGTVTFYETFPGNNPGTDTPGTTTGVITPVDAGGAEGHINYVTGEAVFSNEFPSAIWVADWEANSFLNFSTGATTGYNLFNTTGIVDYRSAAFASPRKLSDAPISGQLTLTNWDGSSLTVAMPPVTVKDYTNA